MSLSELSEYPIPCVGQVPEELAQLVTLYKERRPKRVLEIGVWHGGTLREWLAGWPDLVVAVDPDPQLPRGFNRRVKHGTEFVLITGRSQAAETVDGIRNHAPYDWIFIDGDHERTAVKADADLALSVVAPGGLILLHDITTDGLYDATGPEMIFRLLREEHESWVIVEDPDPSGYPRTSAHGIGVVQM
jgi:predicted O-methyltransferase YrrM